MSESDSTTAQTISMPARRPREIRLDCIELEVVSGSDAGMKRRLPLSIVSIGTAPDNDVVLTDRTVSRHHAQLRAGPDGLLIRDLGSTNGIYLQGGRVVEAYLQPGDTCFLGDTEIAIKQETEEREYEVGSEDRLGALVGGSAPMRELYGMIKAVAPTSMTVLVTGESGSGKEMVAATLHELSGRPGRLTVFDASVTDTEMMRNDLFGHVKGAFTGATAPRDGAFRRADGGTLFIDEIGELPLDLQPKLLRVLESREVVPVGSDRPHPVDVRVIAATHRDLAAMVEAGTFRADLYYRLSVITMRVPPLREILDDIPLLVQNFARRLNLGCRITPDALSELQRHAWPGNARELRNVLERATVLCQGGEIRPEHLLLGAARRDAPQPRTQAAATEPASSSSAQLKMLERRMIQDALARNGNNKAAAARALDMPLSTLKRRIGEFGL